MRKPIKHFKSAAGWAICVGAGSKKVLDRTLNKELVTCKICKGMLKKEEVERKRFYGR